MNGRRETYRRLVLSVQLSLPPQHRTRHTTSTPPHSPHHCCPTQYSPNLGLALCRRSEFRPSAPAPRLTITALTAPWSSASAHHHRASVRCHRAQLSTIASRCTAVALMEYWPWHCGPHHFQVTARADRARSRHELRRSGHGVSFFLQCLFAALNRNFVFCGSGAFGIGASLITTTDFVLNAKSFCHRFGTLA